MKRLQCIEIKQRNAEDRYKNTIKGKVSAGKEEFKDNYNKKLDVSKNEAKENRLKLLNYLQKEKKHQEVYADIKRWKKYEQELKLKKQKEKFDRLEEKLCYQRQKHENSMDILKRRLLKGPKEQTPIK